MALLLDDFCFFFRNTKWPPHRFLNLCNLILASKYKLNSNYGLWLGKLHTARLHLIQHHSNLENPVRYPVPGSSSSHPRLLSSQSHDHPQKTRSSPISTLQSSFLIPNPPPNLSRYPHRIEHVCVFFSYQPTWHATFAMLAFLSLHRAPAVYTILSISLFSPSRAKGALFSLLHRKVGKRC